LWEGEHWLIDILGGYLDGAIWMVLFIFLYNWTTDRMRERGLRKAVPA
jgi:membrane-associated phospholipid phosphatase